MKGVSVHVSVVLELCGSVSLVTAKHEQGRRARGRVRLHGEEMEKSDSMA